MRQGRREMRGKGTGGRGRKERRREGGGDAWILLLGGTWAVLKAIVVGDTRPPDLRVKQ